MLLFTLISHSFITDPLCNFLKAHRLLPKNHKLPNFRTLGKKLVLAGYLKEQKLQWTACSLHIGIEIAGIASRQSFPASQRGNGKLEHHLRVKRQVSVGKKRKLLFSLTVFI